MEKSVVVRMAKVYAEQRGYNISQYEISGKKFDDEWEIYFQRNSTDEKPHPGDFFTVCVDDKSRSIRKIIEGK